MQVLNSAKIYRMDVPYTIEQLSALEHRMNKMKECYIRPVIFADMARLVSIHWDAHWMP
jgi:branched-chain amino acid aminotransferase